MLLPLDSVSYIACNTRISILDVQPLASLLCPRFQSFGFNIMERSRGDIRRSRRRIAFVAAQNTESCASNARHVWPEAAVPQVGQQSIHAFGGKVCARVS